MVAALASWLDARAQGGRWLVRIEDIDTPRCVPGAAQTMLAQLAACGLVPDEPPVWQSRRTALYQRALDSLLARDLAYPCGCTRSDIAVALAAAGRPHRRHGELVYPGTCRDGLHGKPARATRLRCSSADGRADGSDVVIAWFDRRLGAQRQNLAQEVGDIVLARADGLWAYQLAVVVDDADQGVTHVVRGADLADNTPRQIHLQRALGLATPRYLHTPVVLGANGEKLSKQNGAAAVDARDPLGVLRAAGGVLGIAVEAGHMGDWLAAAVQTWQVRWMA